MERSKNYLEKNANIPNPRLRFLSDHEMEQKTAGLNCGSRTVVLMLISMELSISRVIKKLTTDLSLIQMNEY